MAIRFNRLQFQFWNDGPRKVLRPRLPPRGIEFEMSVQPEGWQLTGAVTIPVPSMGMVNVRRSPVTGSTLKIPVGLTLGRLPGPGSEVLAPVPAVSTPVRIEKGCPD